MNSKAVLLIILLTGLILFPYILQAQTTYKGKQNKMSVTGSSTLHEWESEVTQVESSGTLTLDGSQLIAIKDVVVKMPVTGIKSTKGKTMDNKTYEAFNSDKNPTIQYKLTQAKISGSGDFTITATGNLSMAGATRPIEIIAKAKVLGNGDVQIAGSQKLNMRDFNMTPPTAMMGTIKVGEEVTIKFDITLTPNK
ncbi:MAG TPA: YceI family protein [Cyclobacteriaceae bacterium]|nr:YceI family protein [Cyclobacteriaceae bacterium]HRJ82870.1 YceI family protein [Cyclobacteriaceae bacterium]